MTCKPLIIGVAGGSGSGKTTIAKAILSQIGSIEALILQHDSYYRDLSHLSVEKRATVNFDHPDSLETDLMVHQINELIAGREVEVPRYDFTTHSRVSPGTIKRPAEVILVEGILILAEPSLRELMDLKIFVDTDSDLRFIRRLERDIKERGRSMESVVNQYLHSVRPMHLAFVESSRRYADILIPEGYNPVSTGMVVKTIKHWIKEIRSSHQEKEASPHG